MQASTAAPRGTSSRGYSACGAGRGESRELLLHPFPPAMRALRRFWMARQYKFLKNMSAVGTGILEDRHGRPCSLLWFDLTDGVAWFPLRGSPATRSGKPGDAGDSWQDQKPDHQKENVNQEALHSLTHCAAPALAGRSRDRGRYTRAAFPPCAHAATVDGSVRFSTGTQSRHSWPV